MFYYKKLTIMYYSMICKVIITNVMPLLHAVDAFGKYGYG